MGENIVSNPVTIKLRREEESLDNIKQVWVDCPTPEAKYRSIANIYGVITIGQVWNQKQIWSHHHHHQPKTKNKYGVITITITITINQKQIWSHHHHHHHQPKTKTKIWSHHHRTGVEPKTKNKY